MVVRMYTLQLYKISILETHDKASAVPMIIITVEYTYVTPKDYVSARLHRESTCLINSHECEWNTQTEKACFEN